MSEILSVDELNGMMIGVFVIDVLKVYEIKDEVTYSLVLRLPENNNFFLFGEGIKIDKNDFDYIPEHNSCLHCIESFMNWYETLTTYMWSEEFSNYAN